MHYHNRAIHNDMPLHIFPVTDVSAMGRAPQALGLTEGQAQWREPCDRNPGRSDGGAGTPALKFHRNFSRIKI